MLQASDNDMEPTFIVNTREGRRFIYLFLLNVYLKLQVIQVSLSYNLAECIVHLFLKLPAYCVN